jgi:hypothetical protein
VIRLEEITGLAPDFTWTSSLRVNRSCQSHLRQNHARICYGDQPTSSSTIYLGLDVHKDTISVAALPIGAAAPTHADRLNLPVVERSLVMVRGATRQANT